MEPASIISLILWFALLGSLAWFVTHEPEIDAHGEAYGDWPNVPVPDDALGHFGDGV
jgi:hypothetical protein